MLLTTNFFKKEITKNNVEEISLALSCLGNICNNDLGSVVLNQLINLLSHNKPLIRKKASATIVTIFRKSPEIIPQYIDKV
eukprot:CAMPEP_0176451816 /NCGR_PEP_ID=MMETSP0127-20121128/28108_1 /TAXON_ID=938130 /ORGANISM="Platyophrya macrostoma, Strain WH" /LENGTH=80 /DNA_ID=CAMNT_0017840037 /DNA_START=1 /DNA_END=239 /DNA_ORIENTATION=-